jgi:hypothetical protein
MIFPDGVFYKNLNFLYYEIKRKAELRNPVFFINPGLETRTYKNIQKN